MQDVAAVSRILLATVFAVSATSKALDRAGTRQAIVDLGLPVRLQGPLSALLPAVEILTAAGLLAGTTAFPSSLMALALLVCFTALLGWNLLNGRKPACHCFGELGDKPISWRSVARNAGLIALAGLALSDGSSPHGLLGWLQDAEASGELAPIVALVIVVLLAQTVIISRLAPRGAVADTSAKPAGLPIGTVAPDFTLPDLEGTHHDLGEFVAQGKPVLLLFTDAHCGPCQALLPDVAGWQQQESQHFTTVLAASGTREDNHAKASAWGLTNVLLQAEREVATAYVYEGTPGAVLIGVDGLIHSPIASGQLAIQALVRDFLGREPGIYETPVQDLEIGDPLPGFDLETLGGHHLTPDALRGRMSLVVFWDPHCGFCQQLLPDLRQREHELLDAGVQLVVVSAGTAEETAILGFHSVVAIDPHSRVSRALGGFGTPTALLVDADGRAASAIAAGADEVMAAADRATELARLASMFGQSS